MRRRITRIFLPVFLCACDVTEPVEVMRPASAPSFSLGAAATYQDLNLPAEYGAALAINNAGQVLASGFGTTHWKGWFWDGTSWEDIGSLGRDTYLSTSRSLNEVGQVGASSMTATNVEHAVRWSGGVLTDLGDGSETSLGWSINNLGWVAMTRFPSGQLVAHVSIPGESAPRLVAPASATSSASFFVNDAGRVTGWFRAAHLTDTHAFTWTEATGAVDLTPGEVGSRPEDINNAGAIVGYKYDAGFVATAFVWKDGVLQTLPGLGGSSTSAVAINEAGDVLGRSSPPVGPSRTLVWRNGAILLDIASPAGVHITPRDINEAGMIIGNGFSFTGGEDPYVWTGGSWLRLPTPAGTSGYVADINDSGQIVGYTRDVNGTNRVALWTLQSTPESRVEALAQAIESLASQGTLSSGNANSLSAKLAAALAQLAQENGHAAAAQLRAFVNELEALMRSGRLSSAVAQPLIAEALALIAALD